VLLELCAQPRHLYNNSSPVVVLFRAERPACDMRGIVKTVERRRGFELPFLGGVNSWSIRGWILGAQIYNLTKFETHNFIQ